MVRKLFCLNGIVLCLAEEGHIVLFVVTVRYFVVFSLRGLVRVVHCLVLLLGGYH